MDAAEAYAAGDTDGITAARREVLAVASAPKPPGREDHVARLGEPPNLHLNPRSKDGH